MNMFATDKRATMLSAASNAPMSRKVIMRSEQCITSSAIAQLLDEVNISASETSTEGSCLIVCVEKVSGELPRIHSISRFEIFNQSQSLTFPAPAPKLFYGTWWRKIARRLKKETIVAQKK
jgi:hypothetical protein